MIEKYFRNKFNSIEAEVHRSTEFKVIAYEFDILFSDIVRLGNLMYSAFIFVIDIEPKKLG